MSFTTRLIELAQRAKRNLWERPRRQLRKRLGIEPPIWLEAVEANWKNLLRQQVKQYEQTRILEIGCHDGRSSRWIADNFISNDGARLTCVDLWANKENTEAGEITNFELFQRNIVSKKDQVRAMKGDVEATMQSLKREQFDLIFLNGDWEADQISAITKLAISLLGTGGLLLWGPYSTSASVRAGVGRACAELEILLDILGEHLYFRKAATPTAAAQKLVGLVYAKDGNEWMFFSLRALAQVTDAIVVLCDSPATLEAIPESIARECRIARVLQRSGADEDFRLLNAGRELGGTCFVVQKSDEALTSNLVKTGLLRRLVLGLAHGECLQLPTFEMCRGFDFYRGDAGCKAVAFCDDGKCQLNQLEASKAFPGKSHGMASLSFVNRSFRINEASVFAGNRGLNRAPLTNWRCSMRPDVGMALKKADHDWLRGYDFFHDSTFLQTDIRDEQQGSKCLENKSMHKSTPLISAIVSTYKSERFLRGCLEDLERQTIANHLEIIVINSGSPENEESIVREFQQHHKNIVYLRTERETVYQSWNRAVGLARGKYLTSANTDDRHAPDAFEKLAAALENRPDVALAYANCAITQTENATFEKGPVTGYFRWPPFDDRLLFSVCYVGPQPMWRRSLHDQFGLFDPSFRSAGDYEFWLRICRKTRFLHIPETLGIYFENMSSVEHTAPSHQESDVARKKHWPTEWGKIPAASGTFLERLEFSKVCEPIISLKSSAPLVSVIVPTHNRPDMLKEALESILAQTFQDFEIIVVNDGGPDILEMLKRLAPKIAYLRHEKSQHLSAARNTGLAAARGTYIAYLDDDDVFYAQHLECLVGAIKSSGEKVVYSDANVVRQSKSGGRYVVVDRQPASARDWSFAQMLVSNFIPNLCILHEKACLDATGLFDPSLLTHEDWDLWIRLSLHFDFVHLKEITCEYRRRNDFTNTTSSNRADFLRTAELIYKRYRIFCPPNAVLRKRQKKFLNALRKELTKGRYGKAKIA